ncbi:MAG: aspartate 1-decarboxylase [Gammaproteobacteria bacterium]|jgi:aspartate 1-decarboxylase|nr:aspartate 1-decarboxylase [Chromatiales bacterium]MDP6414541.1 aspartate 1-decarboxylase [Gammaproteobacteria bacterium]MDP6673603.1 aspartate 1-decarboxylase [Gammaproteobacteria bacterium]
MRSVLRSKIHKATVTEANPEYVGSITIDVELLERVDLWENERVLIASNTTGARLETYVIAGEPGSGKIAMNGPAAHTIGVGEEVVIMGFEATDQPIEPKVILVDAVNRFIGNLTEKEDTTVSV